MDHPDENECEIKTLIARIAEDVEAGLVRSIAIVVIDDNAKIHEHYAQRKE